MRTVLVTIFFVLIISSGIISTPVKDQKESSGTVGCVSCHDIDKDKINVHLIPHSHDDVGWLKTVDQYFFGLKTDIQHAAVQYIITSVVEALSDDEDRRFIQVESAFFWKWWKSQTIDMRNKFRSLVENGQIEMVNGAWAMNDEACANYQSIIDQFTWGLRTIDETVGTCGRPRVGWQIDPFGHSREQASIFAQIGYDGVFFARLDHDDKEQRQNESNLDFAWQGSANLDNSIIFGGIFPTALYFPPSGLCWDYECDDAPVDDDPESEEYNIELIVSKFVDLIHDYAKYYPTKNVLIPMGGDFQYEAAEMNYVNMDRFIKAFKNHSELNVIYSTPSCYIQAVNSFSPTLKLKTDDFFPYSNDPHSFWTGYFTSRPNSKRFERTGHNILQATKQLVALNKFNQSDHETDLRYLREVMGILQHHDAITGTEKQHVASDYVKLLSRAIEYAENHIGEIVTGLLKIEDSADIDLQLSSCLLTNISICHVSQNSDEFLVAVYNPLSWPVTHYVRLPVNSDKFVIEGPDDEVEHDVLTPISDFAFAEVQNESSSKYDLVFAARDIPPLGIKLFHISKDSSKDADNVKTNLKLGADDDLTFGDNATSFQIDEKTNLLKSVTINGKTIEITQNFYYYNSNTGKTDNIGVSSGAYLFRPLDSDLLSFDGNVENTYVKKGNIVDEFHQKWNEPNVDITQVIRVYKGESYIEFDWLVGNISFENVTLDVEGKEIISKFSVQSDFDNKNVFYTDSNGRELIKRTLNSRSDYTYDPTNEPVASNYYPVTSKIVIKDEEQDLEIAVLNDRSQGGSSMNKNELELMIHRRILHDDNKGVAEALNETEFHSGVYVRGSHFLVIGSATKTNPDGKTTAAQERILAQKKLIQPWVGVGQTTNETSFDDVKKQLELSYSGLKDALPENVNILTLEPWKNNSVLLRVEHILEKDEDPNLSNVTSLDITTLFSSYKVTEVEEMTLAANQLLEDYHTQSKYNWTLEGDKLDVVSPVDDTETTISLTPMQIRTFVVKLSDGQSGGFAFKPISFLMLAALVLYYFI